MDGKAIETHANPHTDSDIEKRDGRRDLDADFGKKVYKGTGKDGNAWEKTVSW